MADVVLPANGDVVEVVAAVSTQFIVYNSSGSSVALAAAVDPTKGIVLKGGETLQSEVGWTAAWTGVSLNGVAVVLKVEQE